VSYRTFLERMVLKRTVLEQMELELERMAGAAGCA
jgi:hypothetical protein